MRVLLTNDAMVNLAGSELVTYNMAVMLRRAGHQPHVFTLNHGRVSEILRTGGIPVTMDLDKWKGAKFDVAHVHHNTCARRVRNVFPRLPMLFVCHGILPELERPPPKEVGVAMYLAVSEEVRAVLFQSFGIKRSIVMRNGVDCGRFRPTRQLPKRPEKVLVISNHFPDGHRKALTDVCRRVGAQMMMIGMSTKRGPEWNTERLLNEADVVVSLGRGALEAMACGRAVLVWDMHGGDGWVTKESYVRTRRCNFSGRAHTQTYDTDKLVELLRAYDPVMGPVNRRLAFQNHNIEAQIPEYESAYKWTVEIGVPKC